MGNSFSDSLVWQTYLISIRFFVQIHLEQYVISLSPLSILVKVGHGCKYCQITKQIDLSCIHNGVCVTGVSCWDINGLCFEWYQGTCVFLLLKMSKYLRMFTKHFYSWVEKDWHLPTTTQVALTTALRTFNLELGCKTMVSSLETEIRLSLQL